MFSYCWNQGEETLQHLYNIGSTTTQTNNHITKHQNRLSKLEEQIQGRSLRIQSNASIFNIHGYHSHFIFVFLFLRIPCFFMLCVFNFLFMHCHFFLCFYFYQCPVSRMNITNRITWETNWSIWNVLSFFFIWVKLFQCPVFFIYMLNRLQIYKYIAS
jgi:hypothetical protein